jgi:hypothetical protein
MNAPKQDKQKMSLFKIWRSAFFALVDEFEFFCGIFLSAYFINFILLF